MTAHLHSQEVGKPQHVYDLDVAQPWHPNVLALHVEDMTYTLDGER